MTSSDASTVALSSDLEKYLRAAMSALRSGDIEVAIAEAEKARSIDSGPQVLIVFAALAHSMGRDVDALSMLEHATKLAPSVGNYPDASAAILLKLGRRADGIFNLKLGTHLPHDPFLSEVIGDFFGDIKGIFDSFIADRPLHTAKLMMSQNMYMSAFHQLETYIGVSGGDSLSFALIAECALRLGKQTDAEVALRALRALDAGYPSLADMELQVAILKGDRSEIWQRYEALQPPTSFMAAIERMTAIVASPYFGNDEIENAKNNILAHVAGIDGLEKPSFNLESDRVVVGFFCDTVDPALEGFITALMELVQIKIYILGPIAPRSQQRLKKAVEDWREVASVDDLTLAEMVRMDQVSVLFDCSALGKFSRPSVLRSRVSPIQILWLRDDGYDDPESYDYYLESSLIKDGAEKPRALKMANPLVYPLPTLEMAGRITELREKRIKIKKKKADQVRLLAPHTSLVVSDSLLECWMEVLSEAPSATLIMLAQPDINDSYVQRIISAANTKSVAGQIELIDPKEFQETLYDVLLEADVILDSFPRGNKEAVWEALLIGCPVVTLAGSKPYDAASSLLLYGGGQEGAIAFSQSDYKARALALALSASERSRFDDNLTKMHKEITLASYQKTAAEMHQKLDALWRNWCKLNS